MTQQRAGCIQGKQWNSRSHTQKWMSDFHVWSKHIKLWEHGCSQSWLWSFWSVKQKYAPSSNRSSDLLPCLFAIWLRCSDHNGLYVCCNRVLHKHWVQCNNITMVTRILDWHLVVCWMHLRNEHIKMSKASKGLGFGTTTWTSFMLCQIMRIVFFLWFMNCLKWHWNVSQVFKETKTFRFQNHSTTDTKIGEYRNDYFASNMLLFGLSQGRVL